MGKRYKIKEKHPKEKVGKDGTVKVKGGPATLTITRRVGSGKVMHAARFFATRAEDL